MQQASEHVKRFNYLSSEINSVYHEASLQMGLSDSASMILYAVCNHGGSCPLNDICRLSGLSKQTVNSSIRRLEADGYAFLEDSDGRKKTLFLTDKGKLLSQNTVVHLIRIENEIFESWSAIEINQYFELTKKYLISFSEKIKQLSMEKTL